MIGDLQVEHEECHGDGEDAVAEGFHPTGFRQIHGVIVRADCVALVCVGAMADDVRDLRLR
ncbi:hypothetical protein GCM10023094_36340 [Rhodococcus olei]|uniref:Uncharacterized protein n=1 Tax=Rhodococcus olei TaxID=2161675 RepID=A0ABP8PBR0_9NOCA